MRHLLVILAVILMVVPLCGCTSGGEMDTTAPASTIGPTAPILSPLWENRFEGKVWEPFPMHDGICVVTLSHMYFFSNEGDLRWSTSYEGSMRMRQVTDGASVYVAYLDGSVERRSHETGDIAWRQSIDEEPNCLNLCLHDGRLYVPSVKDEIVCIDAETGDILWRRGYANGNMLLFSAIMPLGDALLVDTYAADMHAFLIDPATGDMLDTWDEAYLGDMVIHEEMVYSIAMKSLKCLDANGAVEWQIDDHEYFGTWIGPVISYPFLFFVTCMNRMDCIDIRSGEIAWMLWAGYVFSDPMVLPEVAIGNPACVAAEGSMLIMESVIDPGTVIIRDIATGVKIASLPAMGDTPLSFATDGTLLYCMSEGTIACYNLEGI